jgi:peptidyl-tRNA hydrolase
MKMYILVRDDIPLGFAMVAVAHASLAGYLRFQNEPEVREWLSGPFFKAVCKVNAKEFENAKQVADHVVLTESAHGDQEVAIVFKPRHEWPKMFKFLKLYRDPPTFIGN